MIKRTNISKLIKGMLFSKNLLSKGYLIKIIDIPGVAKMFNTGLLFFSFRDLKHKNLIELISSTECIFNFFKKKYA